CRYATYEIGHARSRAEEGERRAADPVARRGSAAAWLRLEQADRNALGWPAPLPRRIALPAALPAGEARLDPGPLDREGGPAAAALLPADASRRARAGFAAQHVARFRRGRQPDYWRRTCLSGRARSTRRCGSISTTSTPRCAAAGCRTTRRCRR